VASTWLLEENPAGGERIDLEGGTHVRMALANRFSIREDDPLSARVECDRTFSAVYPGHGAVRVETRSSMTADATTFHVLDALEAYADGRRVFAKAWSRAIPRDGI